MSDYYSKRTLLDFAQDVRRLNEIGASTNGPRTDSEWFSGHPLAGIPREHRENLEAYLSRIAPAASVTAEAHLTAPTETGIPGPMLAAWLARFPADVVVTRESEEPLTLRATWTEGSR